MKKSIRKLWGIGLVVVLLASILLTATPAAAGDLKWTAQSVPSTLTNQLASGTDIVDMVVAADGNTIYVVTNSTTLYKSTNAGVTWTKSTLAISAKMVAVAPDDANLVIISDGSTVYVSENGAATFSNTTLTASTAVQDIAISPLAGAFHYLTVAGVRSGNATIDYFNLGATVPGWTDAVSGWSGPSANGTDAAYAVAFSPNFASDFTALAVTKNGTTGSSLFLEQVNFNAHTWNSFGTPYPATIVAASTVEAVDLAMAPDYLGADEVMRINFVALAYNSGSGALYRYNDGFATQILGVTEPLKSVAFDGTNLVAGAFGTNNVYRSASALSPPGVASALVSRTYKELGLDDTGNDATLVGFAGGNVVAAKSGPTSGFGVSRDLGLTFNDISLIDTALTNMIDLAVSPDGVNQYFISNDNTNTSVFRLKDGAWERVLVVAGTGTYIARPAPDNMDAIYIALTGSTSIYYSSEAGNTRWYQRAASGAILDLAVEDTNVIYVGIGSGVVKSANGGFTWGLARQAPTFAGNIYGIKVLSAGNLIATSVSGSLEYSSDGGTTWTAAGATGLTNVVADASGLVDGDNIYAAGVGGVNVIRWTIGTSVSWSTLTTGATSIATGITGAVAYGTTAVALENGVLYAFSTNTTDTQMSRSITPSITAPFVAFDTVMATAYPSGAKLVFNATAPNSVKAANDNTFYAVNSLAAGSIVSYKDIFAPAAAAPVLTAPAADYLVPVTLNGQANGFTFSWAPVTGAASYTIQVALDEAFTQMVNSQSNTGVGSAFQVVDSGDLTPGQTYYWRVKVDAPVRTAYSETRMFRVQPSQAMVPVLSSPANGGTIDMTSPGFSWTPITGASSYKFEVSTNAAFATTIYSDEVMTAGAQLPVTIELEQGMQYFWRVKALAPVEGDWSTVGNFMVAAPVETTATTPQITITTQPAPTITITQPGETTITVPAPVEEEIGPAYIWAIIVIGAILVIAVIVLIVRTRRSV